jgi:transcriptional regulator
VTAGPAGLIANAVPFLLYDSEGRGTLRAHVARANPQWRELEAVEECLVVFQGPQSYVSPGFYETKRQTGKVVPTWNYATVHAWGSPRVVHDEAWLRAQIEALTNRFEAPRPAPWAVSDAPDAFIDGQIKGIVGIEIPIARLEGKWKVSQNRSAADRAGVVAGLSGQGEQASQIAALVTEFGPGG